MRQGILLTVDYHDENCVVRRRDLGRSTEDVLTVPTTEGDLLAVLADARRRAGPRGRVVWLQESTTGWARVRDLVGSKAEFLLANVLQMPLPPKGRRQKTDTVDTARLQREYLNGELPLAHQPPAWWRQVRRVVACRENLVSRRTALRNWINRYLAHETWVERVGLWSVKGERRLRLIAARLPERDRSVLTLKLDELSALEVQRTAVEAELHAIYQECADARQLDAVRGIGVVSAVSIVARIGPVTPRHSSGEVSRPAGGRPPLLMPSSGRRQKRRPSPGEARAHGGRGFRTCWGKVTVPSWPTTGGRSRDPEPGGSSDWGGVRSGGEPVAVARAAHPLNRLALAPRTDGHKAGAVPRSGRLAGRGVSSRLMIGGYEFLSGARIGPGASPDL